MLLLRISKFWFMSHLMALHIFFFKTRFIYKSITRLLIKRKGSRRQTQSHRSVHKVGRKKKRTKPHNNGLFGSFIKWARLQLRKWSIRPNGPQRYSPILTQQLQLSVTEERPAQSRPPVDGGAASRLLARLTHQDFLACGGSRSVAPAWWTCNVDASLASQRGYLAVNDKRGRRGDVGGLPQQRGLCLCQSTLSTDRELSFCLFLS
jgi:hypothetical protein